MQFKAGEKVLCFHGPLLYQAKILKAENRTAEEGARIEAAATQEGYVLTTSQAGPFYFVHYQGWKQTWDEWVPETRLMKYNDENIAFSKTLIESFKGAQKNAAGAGAAVGSSSSSGGGAGAGEDGEGSASGPGKEEGGGGGGSKGGAAGQAKAGAGASAASAVRGAKRTRETAELEDEYVKRPEVKIAIPEPLKIILVDDWERVTKNSQLVQLPRRPCVQQVLDDYKAHYIKHRKGAKRTNATTLAEVLDGLRLYFDKSLTHNLLYRFERLQYTDFRKAWMQGQERDAFWVTGAEFAAGVRSRREEDVVREREKGKGKGKEGEGAAEANGSASVAAASTATASGGGGTGKGRGAGVGRISLGEVNGPAMRQRDDLMEPSRIYGAEHLLRLFVNLPSLVAHTTLDSESIQILKDHLTEFMTYMTRERERLFVKEYQPASVDYHRLSGI